MTAAPSAATGRAGDRAAAIRAEIEGLLHEELVGNPLSSYNGVSVWADPDRVLMATVRASHHDLGRDEARTFRVSRPMSDGLGIIISNAAAPEVARLAAAHNDT